MPRDRTEWARPTTDPPSDHLYHWVTFPPGPPREPQTASCGLVARFWPRIGLRMEDRHCEPCLDACADTG